MSTAAAVESALMITNQTNKIDAQTTNNLSFQQMISCDKENLACNGGNIVSVHFDDLHRIIYDLKTTLTIIYLIPSLSLSIVSGSVVCLGTQ